MESSLQELNALSNTVAEYFCEDPVTFKLDECCSIFHSFCKRFDSAVKVKKKDPFVFKKYLFIISDFKKRKKS